MSCEALNHQPKANLQFSGYDMESVLGKEIGPLTVLVRVVTSKPVLWMGLEEICL